MSLLKLLGGGEGIERLARQLNIDPGMANELTKMLAPTLGSAARKRAEAGGLGGLLGQLRGEGNARFYDEPETAASPEARADGENFLESLFGSPDAARNLAAEAAARSGIDARQIEDFLPALAAMTKGGLQKKTPDAEIDGVMNQLNSMMGQSTAEEAPPGDRVADGGPAGLMGAIGNLTGAPSKPAHVDPAKPSHVNLRASKPTGISVGGKPASVSFGMVARPPAEAPPAAGKPEATGGFDLNSIARMFDEDGDGSPLDDILDRLMK